MQPGGRGAERMAVGRFHAARPHALQERGNRRRAPAQIAQRHTVSPVNRCRAGKVPAGQMIHQTEEKRQILAGNAFLIEGQDKISLIGLEQVVGVFNSFGDALAGDNLADGVLRNEGFQVGVRDFGIDGHCSVRPDQAVSTRGRLK